MAKLVRDRIPELIRQSGGDPQVRVLHDDKEYMQALRDKLLEEVVEFEENPCIEELVDVMDVVEALYFLVKRTGGNVDGARKLKRQQKGRFKRRLMLLNPP
jgi:predicted house-cleaning noncanonical NTP pyrophosphatase (MazG superfamily)